jgi:hypothetical protein
VTEPRRRSRAASLAITRARSSAQGSESAGKRDGGRRTARALSPAIRQLPSRSTALPGRRWDSGGLTVPVEKTAPTPHGQQVCMRLAAEASRWEGSDSRAVERKAAVGRKPRIPFAGEIRQAQLL